MEELLELVPQFRQENLDEDITHLVGTPDTVIEQLRGFVDLGVSEIVVKFVDFPQTEGVELFAEQVMPEFR